MDIVVDILLKTYAVVLPLALSYIIALLVRQNKIRKANSRGTMLILRRDIFEDHEKYMERGEIPTYAYENFVEMYEAYHELGGNGLATKMYEEIQELHLKPKSERKKTNEH